MAFEDISEIFNGIFINIKYISMVYPSKTTYKAGKYGKYYCFGIAVLECDFIMNTTEYSDEHECDEDRLQLIKLIKINASH